MSAPASRFQWYSAEDEEVHFKRQRKVNKTAVRDNLVAGQVLILLSGRYRGKRVIFLKQLDSGLLLVTGPHRINGVPLKRVNQAYTITTSTKVDVNGAKFDKVNDETFAKESADKSSSEQKFFAADQALPKKQVSQARKDAQASVDDAIAKTLKTNQMLRRYHATRFTLSKNSKPHAMKF